MKNLIFTIWILVLAVTINIKSVKGQWVPTGPYGGDYMSSSSSGSNLFLNLPESVWGEYKLVRSTDEGINWDVIGSWLNESHTSLKATDAFVFRGTTEGVICRTSNNGLSWDMLEIGTISPGSPVTSIEYLNGILFANVGGLGIYKSTNNGDNWASVYNDLNNYLDIRSFAFSGGFIYAADRFGIIRGDNSLLNWTTVFSDTGLVFNNIINFGTDLFASTTSKGIARSSDYGNTWEFVNAGLSNLSVSTVKSFGVNLFASTIGGGVFMSSNNGVNWTPVNNGLLQSKVLDLFFSNTRIFAGTGSGGIFYSTNNGGNWLNLNVKLQTFGLSTMISNNSYIFTGGYPGIFRSSDNGNSWLFLDKGSEMQTVRSLTTKDNYLFNASGPTGVFRSSDNGSNWIQTNNGLNGNEITSVASNSGYVFSGGGYPGKMFRSSDNGDNWIPINNGLAGGDVYQIISTETALFIGTSSGVFYSSNSGTSWTGSSLNKLVSHITYNGIFVFALVISDGVYRSADNGASWTLVYNRQPEPWVFSIASSGKNIIVGGNDNILYSSNNGDSWKTINEGYPPQQPLSYFLFISPHYIFNGMNFGNSIWKRNISDIFQTPLSGTYTVGSGGTYPTINSAISDANNLGISGPVIFDIISGTYNESVSIFTIPGSSSINTLTLKSQSGNSSDVHINRGMHINSANITISKLTIGSGNDTVKFGGANLRFTENNFNNSFLFIPSGNYSNSHDIFISGNINIGKVGFYGDFIFEFYPTNIHFTENIIIGEVRIGYCKDVFVEKNTIEGNFEMFSVNLNVIKNRITGNGFISGNTIINNFINGTVNSASGTIMNNTIVGGSSLDPTLKCYNSNLLNNIIINPFGGTAINFYLGIQSSECNDLFNGGNNNLIQFEDTLYNSVNDFYNATGFEYHSNSLPVNFVSPSDLHLAGISVGEEGLIGISTASVTDDIDDDPRSPFYPYKGADEADVLLPVELNSFTAIVINNNVQINWVTSFETNNSGFDIERSIAKDQWTKAGFAEGKGNSNTPVDYSFIDKNLSPGKYNYRLKQIDFNGNYEYFNLSGEVTIGIPEKFELSQNYPNPFNPVTNLEFGISELGFVSLKIYDVLGKEVITLVNEIKQAGYYKFQFDGSNFASGVYFYELRSGNFVSQKRMLLLK